VFRNILVGIDGSPGSEQALSQAIDLANATRGRLGLLSVAPRTCAWYGCAPFAPPFSREQMDAELVAEAKRALEAAAAQIPPDLPVTKMLAQGKPADALVTQALDGPWDLIVVGHRPGRRGHAQLVGSSPVPVLIVGETGARSTVTRPSDVAVSAPTPIRPAQTRAAQPL
jgi:nucleotide-binding universal stress UspA family protein